MALSSKRRSAASGDLAALNAAKRPAVSKTVAGFARKKTHVLDGAALQPVTSYVRAVQAGERSDETVVVVVASSGSLFAYTHCGRREDVERYDSENAVIVGDEAGVDGWLAKLVETAKRPGGSFEAEREAASLVFVTESAVRAALQTRGEETPAGEAALADRLDAVAKRTNAVVVVAATYLAADAPLAPSVAVARGEVVEGLLEAGRVTDLDEPHLLSQLPDLLHRMRTGVASQWCGRHVSGGRVVWLDRLSLDRLRATFYEVGNTFTRESQWSPAVVSVNTDATSWLNNEVVGGLDGLWGGCALLLVDRDAVELGALDLDKLAKDHAMAVAIVGAKS